MRLLRSSFLTCCIAVLACTDPTNPEAVALVIISPDSGTFEIGDTVRFAAYPFDANARPVRGRTVVWSSSDPSIVTIGSGGVGITHTAGSALVRAAVDNVADSAGVVVRSPVGAVVISPDSATFVGGDTVVLTATVLDANGHPRTSHPVSWSSSDAAVLRVDLTGVAIATGAGAAWVRATVDSFVDSARFTIIPAIARISVLPGRLVVVPGTSVRLRAVAYLPGGDSLSPYPLHWSSSDSSVATVSDSGDFIAGHVGIATGTVSGGHVRTSAPVIVNTPAFAQLEAGDGSQICGVSTDSLAYCWGTDGSQFGTGIVGGLFDETKTPFGVPASSRFRELHGGEGYTCGLTVEGAPYCWGFRANGRLGDGLGGAYAWSPVAVAGGHTFVTMGVGHSVGCGIEAGGDMYCWGRNSYGELGNGDDSTHLSKLAPVAVVGELSWHSVAPGTLNTCALAADSTAYCWGLNEYGQAGVGG